MTLAVEDDPRKVCDDVNLYNMDEMLKYFATFEKLSGTREAERAVQYIIDRLKQYGVECEKYVFDAYISNPLCSTLEIIGKKYRMESRPRSFSKDCPYGIEGEIIFDPYSAGSTLSTKELDLFYEKFKNKIVLSYSYDEGYAKKIEKYGAIGLIQIWPSKEDALHEDTVGAVWGTPTLDSEYFLLDIPVISIKNSDGAMLESLLQKERIQVKFYSNVDTKVCKVSLPVARIQGKSEDFVLLSGHYDTWYEGMTDNGASNAACLEAARILSANKEQLLRSVRIAWWPGHSNGRYMGSTWYCDNFWDLLYEHCVAHINTDCIGSKDTNAVFVKTTLWEGKNFIGDIVKDITGDDPAEYGRIGRGADQSFWGSRIPIHIMTRHEVSRENRIFACPGAGVWWWHTTEDTYDKIDKEILMKDTKILIETVYKLATAEVLPHDFDSYFDNSRRILEKVDHNSDKEFDFNDMYLWLEALRKKTKYIFEQQNLSVDMHNRLMKLIGGEMNRLMYSYSSRYEHDAAIATQLFPYISAVNGIYKNNTGEKEYLFIKTEFVRQRNRFITEIKYIIKEADLILSTWRS
ncbi:M28 family peptidase [Geosporobacter ferrireducens]|uniref:M28 family peptidase n=1 Tax=Geosporobacter ferrireducens TaxID=1424294 RepID=UPI00139D4F9A|nr:M28 family peptidase [Geosporobacter ferrireducens]MTI54696.1 M28 family peptidase [Geosporobacter ferrireducens]